ncbi:MAG: hypothetical protein IJV81_08535 [Paludibacteraceae bacterium]|nr:hypothetical protein [Paludibacteraceae bacterium]
MDSNNLIFSSKIDSEIEDICFDILLTHLEEQEFEKVYVKNVIIAPNEVLFFADVEEKQTIIRVPIQND